MQIIYSLLLTLSFSLCLAQNNSIQDENLEYPIYPTCKKHKGDNDKLQKCFYENLSYDLRNLVNSEGLNYFENNLEQKKTEIIFTVDKNGELTNLSYTKDSDELLAKDLLRRILKTWKYYKEKRKPVTPAKVDGKPINFTITIPVSVWFGAMN